jgi:uncharacterized Zn finger protein
MARRRQRYGYYGFAPYTTVGEKREQAATQVNKLRKENPDIQPVVISSRTIARSWWGQSWNRNLERYADYGYRLDRGRSYVRCGCVLDLRIGPGLVESIVAGSSNYNYTIKVRIDPLSDEDQQRIIAESQQCLESLADLLAGRFPQELQELFFRQQGGLFPHPQDIHFDCNCPDWADMCKHVAATLYGVGARLDDNPSLFFTLRNIDQSALISHAVATQTDALIAKASATGSGRRRRLSSADAGQVFGVSLEESAPAPPEPEPQKAKNAVRKKKAKKKATKKAVTKKKAAKKAASKSSAKKVPKKKAAKKNAVKKTAGKSVSKEK